jgi:hypothetical protein
MFSPSILSVELPPVNKYGKIDTAASFFILTGGIESIVRDLGRPGTGVSPDYYV